jgi:hypothetical protein
MRASRVGWQSARELAAATDATLVACARTLWVKDESPAWGKRVSPAWGGLGCTYVLADGDDAKLADGWEEGLMQMATAFESRHARFQGDAQKLLTKETTLCTDVPAARFAVDECLFGLRSNRYTGLPMRINTNNVSPGASSFRIEAMEECAHAPERRATLSRAVAPRHRTLTPPPAARRNVAGAVACRRVACAGTRSLSRRQAGPVAHSCRSSSARSRRKCLRRILRRSLRRSPPSGASTRPSGDHAANGARRHRHPHPQPRRSVESWRRSGTRRRLPLDAVQLLTSVRGVCCQVRRSRLFRQRGGGV